MTDQKSLSSTQSSLVVPEAWKEKYLIKRIDEDDIEISLEVRNEILKALQAGTRFIQLGKYTLMLNAIKSIDPKYGARNVPPRPELKEEVTDIFDPVTQKYTRTVKKLNQQELDMYDSVFGVDK